MDCRETRSCCRLGLLFDFDGIGAALGGGLTHEIFVLCRYHLELHHGEQLIFIKLKYLGAQGVAIAVSHAISRDACFHEFLLCPLGKTVEDGIWI
jgi:hypothetical protein